MCEVPPQQEHNSVYAIKLPQQGTEPSWGPSERPPVPPTWGQAPLQRAEESLPGVFKGVEGHTAHGCPPVPQAPRR